MSEPFEDQDKLKLRPLKDKEPAGGRHYKGAEGSRSELRRRESGGKAAALQDRAGWKPALRNTRVALAADGEKAESGAIMRADLLRFNGAVERAPAIDAWMKERAGELGAIAHRWFEVMGQRGHEVR